VKKKSKVFTVTISVPSVKVHNDMSNHVFKICFRYCTF